MVNDRSRDENRHINFRETLTTGEVARAFSVDPKTVWKWHKEGKLSSVNTPGGSRRFHRHEVEKLLNPQEPKNG